MKGGGYSNKGAETDRESLEDRSPKGGKSKEGGKGSNEDQEYEPKEGENDSKIVSEEYQNKVHDLLKDTTTSAHAAHLRHHLGRHEENIRMKEQGDGDEFSTEHMPSTSY